MKKLRFLQIIVIAAAVAVPFAGCKSKPKTELEKLIDEVATPLGEVNMDAGRRLLEIGEPAVEALLKACFEEKSTKKQLVYAHVLARINAEPARMEACIKLLKEHKDKDVRVRAVDGLARHGASDEAIRMAMDIALNDSERGTPHDQFQYQQEARRRDIQGAAKRPFGPRTNCTRARPARHRQAPRGRAGVKGGRAATMFSHERRPSRRRFAVAVTFG